MGVRPVVVEEMDMRMGVGLVPPGPPQAPGKISEAKADEQPGRDLAPGRLHAFEPGHRDTQGDAEETEHDRA